MNERLTEGRSPQKTAHEIARALNSTPDSPWFKRLKMLGNKVNANESLSQGMLVKELLPLISKQPMQDRNRIKLNQGALRDTSLVFNKYFCDDQDSAILKILSNIFSAVRETWPVDWETPKESCLTRAVGFVGIMYSIPALIRKGQELKIFNQEMFLIVFGDLASQMKDKQILFNSDNFPASGAGPKRLQELVEASIVRVNDKLLELKKRVEKGAK